MKFATSRIWIAILAVVAFASPAVAQEITGGIRGSVADSSGGLVSNASITVTQAETGFTRTLVTGADG